MEADSGNKQQKWVWWKDAMSPTVTTEQDGTCI